jgi:hypothetical protein
MHEGTQRELQPRAFACSTYKLYRKALKKQKKPLVQEISSRGFFHKVLTKTANSVILMVTSYFWEEYKNEKNEILPQLQP